MKKQNILNGLVLAISLLGATQSYAATCGTDGINDSSCITGLTANNVENSTAVRNSDGKSSSTYQVDSGVLPFNKPVNSIALSCAYPNTGIYPPWPTDEFPLTPGRIPDGEWIMGWSSPYGYFTYSTDRSGNLSKTTWGVQCKADWRRCEAGVLSPKAEYIYPECNLLPVDGQCGLDNGKNFYLSAGAPTYTCDPNETLIVTSSGTSRQPALKNFTTSTSAGKYNWQCRGFEIVIKGKKSGGKNSRSSGIEISTQSGATASCSANIYAQCGANTASPGSCVVGTPINYSPGGCDIDGFCTPPSWQCSTTWGNVIGC